MRYAASIVDMLIVGLGSEDYEAYWELDRLASAFSNSLFSAFDGGVDR